MSIVAIVAVAALAVSAWLFMTRGSKTCPLCHHPLSAHRRTAKRDSVRHNSYCLRCNKECS